MDLMRCCWEIMTNLLLFNLKAGALRNHHKDNKHFSGCFISFVSSAIFFNNVSQRWFIYFHCVVRCFYICLIFIWCLPFWHFSSDCVHIASACIEHYWWMTMKIMNYIRFVEVDKRITEKRTSHPKIDGMSVLSLQQVFMSWMVGTRFSCYA